MSVFDSLWDRASRVLDKGVDSVLSDRVRYRHNGAWLGTAPVGYSDPVVAAFVINERNALNLDEIDEPLGNRWRVKIAVALVDKPLPTDRIQHPKLGEGWFRPGGSEPQNDGRYWIFDVQGTSAP